MVPNKAWYLTLSLSILVLPKNYGSAFPSRQISTTDIPLQDSDTTPLSEVTSSLKRRGCCSLNFKDCDGTFCGNNERQCLSCDRSYGDELFTVWLPTGFLAERKCLPRWENCSLGRESEQCCVPGVCVGKQDQKRCEAPDETTTREPTVSPTSNPQLCDPTVEYCEFTSTFDVQLGDHDDVLDDDGAQASFSDIATEWLNEQSKCGKRDEVYYSFDFIKNNDIHGRALGRGRTGVASGSCKGYDCPKSVSFTEPSRRRSLQQAAVGDGCGKIFLDELHRKGTKFSEVKEIGMNVHNDKVSYRRADNKNTSIRGSGTQP